MARRRNSKRSNSRGEKSPHDNTSTDRTNGTGGVTSKKDETSDKEVESESKDKAKNDPVWYARYPQLLSDATRLTFSEPFGPAPNLIKNSRSYGTSSEITGIGITSPYYAGLATFIVRSTVGYATDRNDPVNVAASMLYTHVRYVNSGRKNYDPADLMMYVLTIGDLYAFISWLRKVYALAYMYSAKNYFLGKGCLEAMGFDVEDLTQHLANFRYFINQCITKVTSYAIPDDLPYFNLKCQMFSGLYIENPYGNIKDQMYQLIPEAFWRFELDSNGLGSCVPYSIPKTDGKITLANLSTFFSFMLENIWGDEDFGLMSGDIIKAFQGRLIGLATQDDEAAIVPVFDIGMLEKMRNSFIFNMGEPCFVGEDISTHEHFSLPGITDYINGSVRQDSKGNILSRVLACGFNTSHTAQNTMSNLNTELGLIMEPMLNVDDPDPGPEMVIEATRMRPVPLSITEVRTSSKGSNVYRSLASGTEVVTSVKLSYIYKDNTGAQKLGQIVDYEQWLGVFGGTTWLGDTNHAHILQTNFKYLPMLYYFNLTGSSTDHMAVSNDGSMFARSLENWTVCDSHIFARMHEVALLSLLSVPGVAHMVLGGAE